PAAAVAEHVDAIAPGVLQRVGEGRQPVGVDPLRQRNDRRGEPCGIGRHPAGLGRRPAPATASPPAPGPRPRRRWGTAARPAGPTRRRTRSPPSRTPGTAPAYRSASDWTASSPRPPPPPVCRKRPPVRRAGHTRGRASPWERVSGADGRKATAGSPLPPPSQWFLYALLGVPVVLW